MAKITTLKDQSGGVLYPVTKTECVFDLEEMLENSNSQGFLADMNDTTKIGPKGHISSYMYGSNTLNIPSGAFPWGNVVYINGDPTTVSSPSDWTMQIVLPNNDPYIYFRTYVNGSWNSDWYTIAGKNKTVLYEGNSRTTVNISDYTQYKYIIAYLKTDIDWFSGIFDTATVKKETDYDNGKFLINGNNPNDYHYFAMRFPSVTSLEIADLSGIGWCVVIGVK